MYSGKGEVRPSANRLVQCPSTSAPQKGGWRARVRPPPDRGTAGARRHAWPSGSPDQPPARRSSARRRHFTHRTASAGPRDAPSRSGPRIPRRSRTCLRARGAARRRPRGLLPAAPPSRRPAVAQPPLDREEARSREDVGSDIGGMVRGRGVLASAFEVDGRLRFVARDLGRKLGAKYLETLVHFDRHGQTVLPGRAFRRVTRPTGAGRSTPPRAEAQLTSAAADGRRRQRNDHRDRNRPRPRRSRDWHTRGVISSS